MRMQMFSKVDAKVVQYVQLLTKLFGQVSNSANVSIHGFRMGHFDISLTLQ